MMDSPTAVSGTDFVTVFVTDYPAAVEFYGGRLGLEHSVDYGKIPGGEFDLVWCLDDAVLLHHRYAPKD